MPQQNPPVPSSTGRSVSKRARSPKDKRSAALELWKALTRLEQKFPDFSRQLEPAIEAVIFQARRDKQSDKDLVLSALEAGCWVIEEIATETGLSRWDTQKILDELSGPGVDLVEIKQEYRPVEVGRKSRTRLIYRLRSSLPGKPFFGQHYPKNHAYHPDHAQNSALSAE